MQTNWTAVEKKQLWIFVAVAFGMPVLMGILMGISFYILSFSLYIQVNITEQTYTVLLLPIN